MKYQYVVFQGNYDYYSLISKNSEERKDAIFVYGLFDIKSQTLSKILYKIYFHFEKTKHNKLKKLLLPFVFHRRMGKKPVCFVIWSWYANDVKDFLGKYLRKKYPGCKLVCRFEDIIEKMPYRNIEEYRQFFDYLFSFDETDAIKHNIGFFPSWYDSCSLIGKQEVLYDFLFIGRAKDRFKELSDLYESLTALGHTCFFYLVDVPEDMKIDNGIVYGNYLPYKEVLSFVQKSSCLVEIIQKESSSETLRVFESIFYNKKLITNNKAIKNKQYYNDKCIFVYNDLECLRDANIDLKEPVIYEESIRESFRPMATFMFLEKQFEKDD